MIDPGRMEFSWRSEPLHPRPGFGFYPDQVWQALENATQVGNTKLSPSTQGQILFNIFIGLFLQFIMV